MSSCRNSQHLATIIAHPNHFFFLVERLCTNAALPYFVRDLYPHWGSGLPGALAPTVDPQRSELSWGGMRGTPCSTLDPLSPLGNGFSLSILFLLKATHTQLDGPTPELNSLLAAFFLKYTLYTVHTQCIFSCSLSFLQSFRCFRF